MEGDYIMNRFKDKVEVANQPQVNPELAGFIEKTNKPKAYDLQKRQTYMIDIDLIERMDRLAQVNPRGFKVWLINQALREKLDRMEGINTQQEQNK